VKIGNNEVGKAEAIISDAIQESFVYATEYPKLWDTQAMIAHYKTCMQGYEKLQLFRCLSELFGHEVSDMATDAVFAKFINETYHSEMEYILQLNPREFEIVPFYILHRCDEEVEKFERMLEVQGSADI
jgi:hypothetical protein